MRFLEITNYFPQNISEILKEYLKDDEEEQSAIEEIRLRTSRPVMLKFNGYEKLLKHEVTTEDILETLQKNCDNSIYSYQNQICNGYITVKGGHRVGISRKCGNRK